MKNNQIKLLIENVEKVIKDKREQIILAITCLLADGHILMEDNPGTGKTVLAKTLAKSIKSDGEQEVFKRIQFTPDLLPMDLLGTYLFDNRINEFIFQKGPLFSNIILADEINRASPKVQSALLECMAEKQITMGNQTYKLEDVFFTIATQNPIEMEGTYPLPAAQLDRFSMKINFGYMSETSEFEVYKNYQQVAKNQENTEPVLSILDILNLRKEVDQVVIHDEIIESVKNIVYKTRSNNLIVLGASPRAGISLLKCLRAYAFMQGRQFVNDDDLKALTIHCLNHRLVFRNSDAKSSILNEILQEEIKRLSNLKLN